jgi:hypothetical protein
MKLLDHRHDIVLGRIEYSARDDETFHLLIREDGSHFIQIHYSPNRDYSRPRWSGIISPSEYLKHKIDGINLATLIDNEIKKRG